MDLSTDGKNRVQLQADGSVTYSMDYMNDESFTGRININQGFARYTPPLMGEKLFNFEEGSYVAFNGEMMNPVLNIKANDEIKANVSQSGADTRQVTFNVALTVTGTLESMKRSLRPLDPRRPHRGERAESDEPRAARQRRHESARHRHLHRARHKSHIWR